STRPRPSGSRLSITDAEWTPCNVAMRYLTLRATLTLRCARTGTMHAPPRPSAQGSSWRSGVDHEFEKVPVGVANVHTRAGFPAGTRTVHRAQFDLDAGAIQQGLERLRRSVPDEAEIATRWPGSRSPKRETRILPATRTMEVDHLRSDIDGNRVLVLTHLKPEPLIERNHRIRVLHGQRNVIEAADPARLLRSQIDALTCRACGSHRLHKCATRAFVRHA